MPIDSVALQGSLAAAAVAGGAAQAALGISSEEFSPIPSILRIRASKLTYERFLLDHMEPGQPLVIQGATDGWRAMHDWAAADGGVDLDYLEERFGLAQVTVTDTSRCLRCCTCG
jgi:hypothetical protein